MKTKRSREVFSGISLLGFEDQTVASSCVRRDQIREYCLHPDTVAAAELLCFGPYCLAPSGCRLLDKRQLRDNGAVMTSSHAKCLPTWGLCKRRHEPIILSQLMIIACQYTKVRETDDSTEVYC